MKYKEKMPSASRELRWSTICTGTTQRDGMGREVGWGFGMGDTGTPVADYVNVGQNPQYYKVISLQLKLIN